MGAITYFYIPFTTMLLHVPDYARETEHANRKCEGKPRDKPRGTVCWGRLT